MKTNFQWCAVSIGLVNIAMVAVVDFLIVG